jgi:hypothetical protein
MESGTKAEVRSQIEEVGREQSRPFLIALGPFPEDTATDNWVMSAQRIPPPQKSDRGLVVYTSEVTKEKGALKLHRTLNLDALLLDVKNYPAVRHFFQEVRTMDEQQVLLQPPAASASN